MVRQVEWQKQEVEDASTHANARFADIPFKFLQNRWQKRTDGKDSQQRARRGINRAIEEDPISQIGRRGDHQCNAARYCQVFGKSTVILVSAPQRNYKRTEKKQAKRDQCGVLRRHGETAKQTKENVVATRFRVEGHSGGSQNKCGGQRIDKSAMNAGENGWHASD
jgi:hypothetical protein